MGEKLILKIGEPGKCEKLFSTHYLKLLKIKTGLGVAEIGLRGALGINIFLYLFFFNLYTFKVLK